MTSSLRTKLYALIKEKGYLDYAFAVSFAAEEGYRLSNLERRMRELCNEYPIKPVIKKSKRNTNYIAGWELENDWSKRNYNIVETITVPTPNRWKCDRCLNDYYHVHGTYESLKLPPAFAPKKENKKVEGLGI